MTSAAKANRRADIVDRLEAENERLHSLLQLILSGIERKKIPDQTILRRNGEEIETEALSDKIRTALNIHKHGES